MAKEKNRVSKYLIGKTIQLRGTLFYPNILAPRMDERSKKEKFGVMFAWEQNENREAVGILSQWLGEIKQQMHPTIPDYAWVNPLKDYMTTKRTDGKGHPDFLKGMKWINASNQAAFPPEVLIKEANAPRGMRPATAMDSVQIFDGQKAIISLSFFGLDGENSKWGVSANIDAVLIEGGGARVLTGNGGIDVNQAFGSFLGQMGGQPQQAPQQNNFQQAPQQTPQYAPQENNMGNGHTGHQSGNYATGANPNAMPNQHGQTQGANAYPSNPPQQNPQQGQNYGQQFNQQFPNQNGYGNNNNGGSLV